MHEVGQSLPYIVQEIRNCLSCKEALFLRWLRNNHNWDLKLLFNEPNLRSKIISKVMETTWNRQPEWAEEHWLHFTKCAIMEI